MNPGPPQTCRERKTSFPLDDGSPHDGFPSLTSTALIMPRARWGNGWCNFIVTFAPDWSYNSGCPSTEEHALPSVGEKLCESGTRFRLNLKWPFWKWTIWKDSKLPFPSSELLFTYDTHELRNEWQEARWMLIHWSHASQIVPSTLCFTSRAQKIDGWTSLQWFQNEFQPPLRSRVCCIQEGERIFPKDEVSSPRYE